MKLSEELQQRGFVHQFAGETLEEIVDGEKRTVYHGIDPTADSAHAGNFVQWVLLRHFVNNGHKVIFLVGGGTGRIGDPKPDEERTLAEHAEIDRRVEKLRAQAQHLLGTNDITFVDNYDWLKNVQLIDFLRDIGKHFTINELVKKEAIAKRMESDVGISYTEFAYPLLQAYDFLQLHEQYGCDLQTGGSDQWGNIVSGVDLIRRLKKETVFALTQPLVIDKTTGKKFGKSEGNAVWLDPEKTTPYNFYQFWLNTTDDNVIDFLKRFTFIPLDTIAEIEQEFEMNPGARAAQKQLAYEVTKFVHGAETVELVKEVSDILFGDESINNLSATGKQVLLENAPTQTVANGTSLVEVLVESGLASSKREARTFIESGAISINGEKATDPEAVIADNNFFADIVLLRRGKKYYCVLTK